MHDAVLARLRVISVLFALGLLSVGCGGGDGDPVAQPTTTLTQEARDEAELIQLAEDWDATLVAMFLGETDVERASEFVAGDYLNAVEVQVADFAESGQSIRRNPATTMEVLGVVVTGDSAVVTECVIDADELIGSDGQVVDDRQVAKLFETTAERGAGGWRFVGRNTVSEAEGADSCES